jgi:hypothetical protein
VKESELQRETARSTDGGGPECEDGGHEQQSP